MMGLEMVRGMDQETYLRLNSVGMMTAKHISNPIRMNLEEAKDTSRVDTTQACLNDTNWEYNSRKSNGAFMHLIWNMVQKILCHLESNDEMNCISYCKKEHQE
jgi:hypothetical protein